jgi:FtsP/CotA-like multicopper oxidase with cupredoxin domain
VKNNLGVNGTGIHWHGMRQLKTCTQDGVPGLTECPLSPGDTKTYTFKATQHGTTWYHSHFSSQYGEGAFGPLIIDGPASSNYDEDLGPYMVNDYYYQTAWQLSLQSHNNLQMGQPPPPADNLLVNGTAMSPSGAGKYSRTQMQKGKRYRLRLINPSVDNFIRVSLDGHSLTVISSDLIPIMPYNTTWVLFGPGQRYDVIIEANADVGNYWFRAETETACASSNNFYGRGIFSYAGAPAADPASSAATKPSNCIDESPLVPWVPNNVGSVDDFKAQASNLDVDLTVEQLTTNGQSIVVWGINLTSVSPLLLPKRCDTDRTYRSA